MPRHQVDPGEDPYAVEIALVDDLQPGDVAVFACGGPTDRIAPWGELLSTAAQVRGSAGCVTDGLVRDVRPIRAMRFPVFHGGIGPLDSKGRGKMMELDCRVVCAGVAVSPGDYVFGDVDGVVVVPATAAAEVFALALEKVAAEDRTRDALRAGRSLRDVFDSFGVL
jgi:regulator of RNase E activity RraA